jgi:ABC-type amino acid transport substrate-binding protein
MRLSIHRLLCALILFVLMGLQLAPSQAQSPNTQALRVAIKPLTPFVMKQDEAYTGFSIELWNAIAQRNNWRTEFVWRETVSDLLNTVQQGQADVGIAGISMTPEREAVLDFSHPMFNAGLQIMVPMQNDSSWRRYWGVLFNPDLLRIVLAILVMMLAAGHVIWLAERRHNPDFQHGYGRGVWEGIWWAAVTVATVGYGDRTPKGAVGRLFAILWMFTGIILVANFTATVTSNLTLQEIRGTVNSINDLPGKRVATVAGSTASSYLNTQGVSHQQVTAIEEAYALLDKQQLDAIVYDSPVLHYYAAKGGQGKVRIVGALLKPEEYGIALPIGSPIREEINRALLALQADGTYAQLQARWFGARESQ